MKKTYKRGNIKRYDDFNYKRVKAYKLKIHKYKRGH